MLSFDIPLNVTNFIGQTTDFGNPGHRIASPLPVELSSFNVVKVQTAVNIEWTTESEFDNAGFNILRSSKPNGPFRVINSKLIQGAGTTGERNTYTWTDFTSKQNTEYYYQIEDVSLSGISVTLSTKRKKGVFSARNRVKTLLGGLKIEE